MLDCSSAMKEIEAEYSDLPLKTRTGDVVRLRNLLMLDNKSLGSASALLKLFSDDAALDVALPKMRELLLLLADKPKVLDAELKTWPIAMYQRVIEAWMESTELGEASDSAS